MERAVIQPETNAETSAEEAAYPIYDLGVSYYASPEAALTEERGCLGGTTSETQAAAFRSFFPSGSTALCNVRSLFS
jgi:hypothetical protein